MEKIGSHKARYGIYLVEIGLNDDDDDEKQILAPLVVENSAELTNCCLSLVVCALQSHQERTSSTTTTTTTMITRVEATKMLVATGYLTWPALPANQVEKGMLLATYVVVRGV